MTILLHKYPSCHKCFFLTKTIFELHLLTTIPENLKLGVLLIRILPGLGKTSVIPEDRSVVITKVSLLDVLSDGVGLLLGSDLHLRLGHLRDLYNHVVSLLPLKRDVMPWGDLLVSFLEVKTEGLGSGLSSLLGGNSEKSSSAEGSSSGDTDGGGPCVSGPGKGEEGEGRYRKLHVIFFLTE